MIVLNNRACHQLWKIGHKAEVVQKGVMRRISTLTIAQKGNLLEGKETDSERECYVKQCEIPAENQIDIGNKKIIVFKIKKQTEIENDTEEMYESFPAPFFHGVAAKIIDTYTCQN